MLFFAFLLLFIFLGWTAVRVFGQSERNGLRIAYASTLAGLSVLAFWVTYHYEYLADEKTRVCGWPVPSVIFQKDTPEGPWLDYVGPTTLLGWPMNLAIYMLVPSLLFFGLTDWKPGCSAGNQAI